jgi:hypothetical protein
MQTRSKREKESHPPTLKEEKREREKYTHPHAEREKKRERKMFRLVCLLPFSFWLMRIKTSH